MRSFIGVVIGSLLVTITQSEQILWEWPSSHHMWSLDANRWNRLLTGWSSPGSKTCTPWTLHGTPWPPQHHWALEENIPSTGHEEFKSNTAPYVPQNTERGHLGICLQSFIIAGGACKVNWANLIFMVEPIAAVMRNTFSLLLPPLCVFCGLCFFFTGNRTLIPYSVSLDIGLLVKTNSDCQGCWFYPPCPPPPRQLEQL